LDAEDLATVDTDDDIVGDEGSKASYGEVEDEDSNDLEDDDFASSSEEESDAAKEVAAARTNRSTGRASDKLQLCMEARAAV
jgi:phosphopantothenoylcysteine synthetase/decarboxylase